MSPTRTMPPAEALAHLAGKVSDQSTAIQAMQIDQQYIRKALEKLVTVGEKQIELTAQMGTHGEAIDRAFRSVDGVKTELTAAIRELTESLKPDRESAKGLQQTVAGFKGSLRAVGWLSGALCALVVYAFISTTSGIKESLVAQVGKQERERIATDIKIDALSQQTQEVRLDRQRDREQETAP